MPVISALACTLITQQTLYPLAAHSVHDEFTKVTKMKIQPKKDTRTMYLLIYCDTDRIIYLYIDIDIYAYIYTHTHCISGLKTLKRGFATYMHIY